MAGTSTTAVFVAALGALSSPAWAEPHPDVADRPPVTAPFSPRAATPSGSGTYPSPPVADADRLERTIRVAPFDEPRSREYFAVSAVSLDRELIDKVREIDGVRSVEVVDAARIKVDGVTMSVLGVNPSTFRNYAPLPSAKSDEIWQGIAEGRIALSNDAGTQRDLKLGSTVAMAGAQGTVDKEVWTHATSGVAGIDALISRASAAELGFPRGNGLIVSAPGADLWQLREDLRKVLGPDISLQVLAEEDPGPRRYDAEGVPVSEEVIERMIAAAESQLGVPYVWGGTTPGKGFDCSGLVQWAFRQAGVEIPRVTHDQWWTGEHLDYSEARRGDLLFWRTDPTAPDYISHVAIYLGNGKMLEAPRTGDVVKITDVRLDKMAGVVRVHVAE
ncbi:MAG: C40 family peptidase [Thermobifida fusca]|jgi:cell wall-associated NlpC family hydrolase|uniref:C40 family peptidase n=1 Tax=Thermobifida TaxID=83677 RepID=UPI000CEE86A8|nr:MULTISPECIES: C40 family peptidase [Thermobifida]MBO2530847.1 hydrolase [Thermobifida sp.]PPS95882.1 hydrolase [Thermobifida fusca]PZN64157.1 MAG: peptidoglycan endopeptidase [Thermobifida fusca]QOS58784.1 C40 family peptidase [Thermobifida fusca]